MVTLYNPRSRGSELLENLNKNQNVRLVGVLLAGLLLVAGCHRSAGIERAATDPAGEKKAAAESVAEADRNYAQREDLAKVRTAVALLRQARTADYGNFEAAWKLARADYYLGTHST